MLKLRGPNLLAGEHLKFVKGGLPGGVKPEDFDFFHELITHEEMGRLSVPSYTDG